MLEAVDVGDEVVEFGLGLGGGLAGGLAPEAVVEGLAHAVGAGGEDAAGDLDAGALLVGLLAVALGEEGLFGAVGQEAVEGGVGRAFAGEGGGEGGAGVAEGAEEGDPVGDLAHEEVVGAFVQQVGAGLLDFGELGGEGVEVGRGGGLVGGEGLGDALGGGGDGDGFLAAVAVAVGALVGVVLGEDLHGAGDVGECAADAVAPGLVGVEVVGVPGVGGDAEEGDFGGFGLVHGVGDEAGVAGAVGGVVAVAAAEEEVGLAVVAYGPVPPDVGFSADLADEPFGGVFGDVGADRVARPHHLDVGVEAFAEDVEVGAAGPGFVVLGGAEDEGGDVAFGADEVAVDVVEELDLLFGAGAFAADVVEEDGEGADAELVHHLELRDAGAHVAVVFPVDVAPGMDGPDEVDLVGVGGLDQLGDAAGLGLGVGVAPAVGEAVEGVVLGAVDVGVHLRLPIEAELALTRLKAPGEAVEAFDRAAEGHIRPVFDRHALVGLRGQELAQGLHAVEEARAVGGGERRAVLAERQGVAFLGERGVRLPGEGEGRAGLDGGDFAERRQGVGVEAFGGGEGDCRGAVEGAAGERHLLGRGPHAHGGRERVGADLPGTHRRRDGTKHLFHGMAFLFRCLSILVSVHYIKSAARGA